MLGAPSGKAAGGCLFGGDTVQPEAVAFYPVEEFFAAHVGADEFAVGGVFLQGCLKFAFGKDEETVVYRHAAVAHGRGIG